MWVRIAADGPVIAHQGIPSLELLQATVGGYVEVRTLPGMAMWMNEDGKRLGLPVNAAASLLTGLVIRGQVAITGAADAEGEVTSLTPELLELLR